jgi:hypothetical protein
MKKLILGFLFLGLSSCSNFVKEIDSKNLSSIDNAKKENLYLLFSHNLSGETHPCGCRQFPLGGLPQVYGLHQTLKAQGEILYVDTGDTFFPSSNIPKSMNESLSYAANNLASGLDKLGLNYFIPGDQDFALGIDFLKNLAQNHKFIFLISNLKDENLIKHERMAIIERGKTKIFLVGLVNPEAINTKEAELFRNPNEVMKELLGELLSRGMDLSNPYHRLIVLSHAGIDLDEKFAEAYPQIDWIIGAHSQSFLRYSRDVGNVKIVQTLSKNHYVGDITIATNLKKESDTYTLHEIRDELEAKANPNPMREFIDAHKAKMSELQLKEQNQMVHFNDSTGKNIKKFKSPKSCMECHKAQHDFWSETPHSIAFATLMNAKEQTNLQCIKCHSLGLDDPRGFTTSKNIIAFKDRPIIDYWNEAHALTSKVQSVRKLSPKEIKVFSSKWQALDQKNGIKHNFANVQCLNCHDKHEEHPFEASSPLAQNERQEKIKSKCLTCHTPDQSPEWYNKDEKGLASKTPNEKVFGQKFKKMSCPLSQ